MAHPLRHRPMSERAVVRSQNSDAVLIMVQYESALEAFYGRYHKSYLREFGHDVWLTVERMGTD